MFVWLIAFSLLLSFQENVIADTPANCTFEDVIGKWSVYVGPYQKDCNQAKFNRGFVMEFSYPNIVTDSVGNIGQWSLVYNQGFEFTISNRKWLAMFDWTPKAKISLCSIGRPGWTYDVLLRQFACAKFHRTWALNEFQKESAAERVSRIPEVNLNVQFRRNQDFIDEINRVQSSWKAVHYPQFENMTLMQIQRIQGSVRAQRNPGTAPVTPEIERLARMLPKNFDWRIPKDGQPTIVTPVRNQGDCGSCYAFASAGAVEARVRLATGGFHKPILSPQDIVDCSTFSEGCDGGFPYLVAGKYGELTGLAEESCNPYKGVTANSCDTKIGCRRSYTTKYHYVGGYYGATNEALMMLELVHKGPMPIGLEVYDDFKQYKGGIYERSHVMDKLNKFNPFDITNHAVLLVGYGYDDDLKKPYWIVKNSWGPYWGEKGFFRILRGANECGVESEALSFEVVV